jgi:cytochrome c oxidase subunit 2
MRTTFVTRRSWLRAAGVLALGPLAAWVGAAPPERVVKVVAKKFEFVPPVIRMKKGETVVLHVTAPEVPMGMNFADFGVRADIVPGKVAQLRLVPTAAGTFTFVCDVFCGSGHEDMSGTLIVSE